MAKTLKIRQLTFRCPHCGTKISADPSNAGRCIPCPTCSKPLQFPHEMPVAVGEAYVVPFLLLLLPVLRGLIPNASAEGGWLLAACILMVLLAMLVGHLGAILRRLKHLEELSATLPRTPPEVQEMPEEYPGDPQ